MHISRITSAAFVLFTASLCAKAGQPRLEPTEWSRINVIGADQTNVTRVLFVGDSILGGYGDDVASRLGAAVRCATLETSCSVVNPDYAAGLDILLKRYTFAVIHINNGLHGMANSDDDYATALTALLALIKQEQPNARVIWALTTPVRKGEKFAELDTANAARVQARNKIASELMKKYGYAIDDLYSVVIDHPEYYSDGTHYNYAGRKAEADQVEQAVRAQLADIEKPAPAK